jgi:fumarate reductase subunit D
MKMKVKKAIITIIPAGLMFFPDLAHAQTIQSLIGAFQSIINMLIPFMVGLAVFAVLFGLMRYAFKAGDEKAQEEGRRIMFWGVVTLFVMVSIWGFVSVLQNLFFGSTTVPGAPEIPTLPTTPVGGSPNDDAGDSTP